MRIYRRATAEIFVDEIYGFVGLGSDDIVVYRPGEFVGDNRTKVSVMIIVGIGIIDSAGASPEKSRVVSPPHK